MQDQPLKLFDLFERLPNDMQCDILGCLTSKERAESCTVSWQFYLTLQQVSKCTPECMQRYSEPTDMMIASIYIERNYHLLVRMKNETLVNLDLADETNDVDLIHLAARIYRATGRSLKTDQCDYRIYTACLTGHQSLLKLMIAKGVNDWNSVSFEECEGGHQYQSFAELMLKS